VDDDDSAFYISRFARLLMTKCSSVAHSSNSPTARKRSKELVEHLQDQVEELTKDKAELKRGNELMRAQLELLEQQNRTLMMNQLASQGMNAGMGVYGGQAGLVGPMGGGLGGGLGGQVGGGAGMGGMGGGGGGGGGQYSVNGMNAGGPAGMMGGQPNMQGGGGAGGMTLLDRLSMDRAATQNQLRLHGLNNMVTANANTNAPMKNDSGRGY
jgi:hypothetical protein